MKRAALLLSLFVAACAPSTPSPDASAPALDKTASAPLAADVFLSRLNQLCGQRFEGQVVSTDAADADMASQRLLMHVRDCAAEEVRIPFQVGEDRSRT